MPFTSIKVLYFINYDFTHMPLNIFKNIRIKDLYQYIRNMILETVINYDFKINKIILKGLFQHK